TPLKMPQFIQDELITYLKGQMGVFLVLPLIVTFLRMCSGILTEKEKKIREGMKIMGMSNFSFYSSWISWYLMTYTIISLIVSAILKATIFKQSDYLLIFVWHWLFCVSLIIQSIFITSFFSRAKLGNIISMVFFLVMFMIKFIIGNSNLPLNIKVGASLSSHTSFSLASDIFLLVENQGYGITWSSGSKMVDNFSIGISMGMCILNIFIFAILSWYCEQVIPNEFGKKKHPLFFITCLFKKNIEHGKEFYEDKENLIPKENVEEVQAGLKQQEQNQEVLRLNNVYKVYNNGKKAVNGVNLTMYKNQIFCLLGHNGAGKTTTISMLTGMLEFSQGQAEVYGKDITNEIEDIRKFMGVCPQHDILFDNLTVKEHLELYAVFKGMDNKDIPLAVQKAIIDVDLAEKTNELSKNLSGGQKRRLSVAIAFIGGSKLIYLDEPTSGMDTSARRYIWDMLKKYKNDKIIVLTTHFMDEADYLGDRIGIMGEGKLICCGSSVFLKNRFGVGYNLT
ncbi:hypothetical protein IMG5_074470, partial [Ichthyophthirius multifiliis]